VEAGDMTREEAIGGGMVLIPAGHETTANMIAMSTILLLENPGQLDEIRAGGNHQAVRRQPGGHRRHRAGEPTHPPHRDHAGSPLITDYWMVRKPRNTRLHDP